MNINDWPTSSNPKHEAVFYDQVAETVFAELESALTAAGVPTARLPDVIPSVLAQMVLIVVGKGREKSHRKPVDWEAGAVTHVSDDADLKDL